MTTTVGNYDLLQRNEVDYTSDTVLTKWRSRKTGLTVVHVDNGGMSKPLSFHFLLSISEPFIRAYLTLRTEGT